MKINEISKNDISYKAKLKLKGKKFLTEEQFNKLEKKVKEIGNDNDLIEIAIGEVKKESQHIIEPVFDEFNQFTRKLYISHNINGKQSQVTDLMWGVFENSKNEEPSRYSNLNYVFSYIMRYLEPLSKSK